jgi:hypothetical protein
MKVFFRIGQKVRWVRAVSVPEYRNVVGMIVAVVPDGGHSPEFSMYDVQFPFGTRTLYGTQIEADTRQETSLSKSKFSVIYGRKSFSVIYGRKRDSDRS